MHGALCESTILLAQSRRLAWIANLIPSFIAGAIAGATARAKFGGSGSSV